ncbi:MULTISPECIES: aldo/keto reductase [Tritonibacter]|jgi:aryl-alcohol dehydrogenase-like predicted oxidoreductase|uniref:Aldo/keto reductase n=2 Tax=Tritonibacter TaxID=2083206 RepID=A0A843YNM6_9RHOB|nr:MULTISPECIES: aldo/keto reductase [Tritonibacter]KUP94228.1 general stress protein 69 [Tritonibacter horizontis]MQQ10832.1 aldo/keto reductase [Tritonibacter litoralis]
MKKRALGGDGFSVSTLGLGCMGMSEFYGPSDDAENLATLDAALERGIDIFDTADMYGHGANEELLGRFLIKRRGQVKVATKFGILRSDNPDARPIDSSPEYLRSACEASLRRLGVDTIDLYYMHRRNVDVPIEDTVGAMARLVQEGKIRALGLCEVAPDTIRRAHATHPITAIQTEYSLWSRDVEAEILPLTKELGIGFVPYSPLGRGALTGALRSAGDLAEDDFRRTIPRYAPEVLSENLKSLKALQIVADRQNATPAQIALAWLLAQGEQIVPIPGTRRPERLVENAGAVEIKLSSKELASLSASFSPATILGSRTTNVGSALIDL